MVYKAYRSYCLAGDTGFPPEAVPVPAPFAPVLFLHPAAPGGAAACTRCPPWPR